MRLLLSKDNYQERKREQCLHICPRREGAGGLPILTHTPAIGIPLIVKLLFPSIIK